jgi:predicted RNA-binding protein with PUA-like domain
VLHKTRNLTLAELRTHPELADLGVLRKGNRLSIQPVEPQHWRAVLELLGATFP